MSERSKEVVVRAHCVNILNTVYPVLRNYPKMEQGRLCSFILGTLCHMVSYSAIAEKRNSIRIASLQRVQAETITLKTLLELSFKERYISKGFLNNCLINLSKLDDKVLACFSKPKKEQP